MQDSNLPSSSSLPKTAANSRPRSNGSRLTRPTSAQKALSSLSNPIRCRLVDIGFVDLHAQHDLRRRAELCAWQPLPFRQSVGNGEAKSLRNVAARLLNGFSSAISTLELGDGNEPIPVNLYEKSFRFVGCLNRSFGNDFADIFSVGVEVEENRSVIQRGRI